jgi:catechol 2,3-dioxygenase-like lactoylglutathione lyase family enzyme
MPLTLKVMITVAIPVIAVSDSARAEDYYCRVLGFTRMSVYPPDAARPDPRYLGLARDGVWVHLQSYKPERAGMTDAFFWVADVDQLHEEFRGRGAVVQLPPTDQSWGLREMGIRDPDGNVLGFATRPG